MPARSSFTTPLRITPRSRIVTARVPYSVAVELRKTASALGISLSSYICRLSKEAPDAETILRIIAKELALRPDATPPEIIAALNELVAKLPPEPEPEPAGEIADPPSPAALAACKAKGWTLAELARRKAAATRRASAAPVRPTAKRELTDAERREITRRGWTPAEYQTRKARATRRA